MTKSILAAGTLALAVTITRVAPAPHRAVATAAPSPDPASTARLPREPRWRRSRPPRTMARTPATAARAMTAGTTAMGARVEQRREGDEPMTKPMTKSILAAGALALAVASGPPAFGHGMRGGAACGHGALLGGGRMLHALDLTVDQKQEARDIFTAHRPMLARPRANEKAA